MVIRGAIYYKDYNLAQEQLEAIIKGYTVFGETEVTTRSKEQVTFSNGDQWRLISANFPSRGYRFHIAYIERSISEEIFYTVIKPCLTYRPFSAFSFFGKGDLQVTDKYIPLPF